MSVLKVGRISFGVLGDQSQLTPEASKALKDLMPSMASFLAFLQSPAARELEKKYREGAMSQQSLSVSDWFGTASCGEQRTGDDPV